MSDTITVTVNNTEETIPEDFGSTPTEFAEVCLYQPGSEYNVYRVDDVPEGAHLGESERCSEPLVVDDGDEFAIIPKYTTGG